MIGRVKGFGANGVRCGLKKKGLDLALIYSESKATAAGVFTTNKVRSAHVVIDEEKLKSGTAQAIVINSGNANACNGEAGLRDASRMCALAARELGIDEQLVLCASTGIIGRKLPVEKIERGIKELAALGGGNWRNAARAIMTTDTREKYAFESVKIGGKKVSIGAIAKGAGMISPKMATMLCFIATDAVISAPLLRKALGQAVEKSFNRVSVDGDTSTNDSVIILANGRSGARVGEGDYAKFEGALEKLCVSLAKQIAADGEGASKLVEVRVKNAASEADALRAARAVAESLLVKTALHGGDPNWVRIVAAVGRSGAVQGRVGVAINRVKVAENGIGTGREGEAGKKLKGREVIIEINLNAGGEEAVFWSCDLSEEYVKINSLYET